MFSKGQSPKADYLPGLKRITEELLDVMAVALNKGNDDSQRLALMVAEMSRLLIENPLKLDEVIKSVDTPTMKRLARITEDFPDNYAPEGYDPEGFRMFDSLQGAFLGNTEGFAKLFSLPPNIIHSMGVMLYYFFLSTLDESEFAKMEALMGL
jgi:hypothetical protein